MCIQASLTFYLFLSITAVYMQLLAVLLAKPITVNQSHYSILSNDGWPYDFTGLNKKKVNDKVFGGSHPLYLVAR